MLWKILVWQIQKSITISKESAVVSFDHNDDYFIQCNNQNHVCQNLVSFFYIGVFTKENGHSIFLRHTGIHRLWTQELDAGLWTLDAGRWTLDSGRWTLDSGHWTLDSGRWTLHLGSQALGTKYSCQLVQNKIRTQFQFLILSRVQVLTLNVKCYIIKKYRNKFLL